MEKLTNWCVYLHENRVNGKKYIGITSQKPTRRWANGRGYIECPIFYAAIQKYGWDAFRHELLYTDLTQEDAERLEAELIAKYQTVDPAKGYNIRPGGAAVSGWHHTEETKARMSASRMGHETSEETREKLRAANTGRTLSPEARAKMSAAKKGKTGRKWTEAEYISHKGKQPAEIPAMWKAVKQFTDSGELIAQYPSRKAAAAATGVATNRIAACCRGRVLTAGGYRWADADKERPNMATRPDHSEVMRKAAGRAVVCVETGQTFCSISEAASVTGAAHSKISACCRGQRKTTGGYHWEYVEAVAENA